ncbi:MAG: hypothetical protein GC156_07750 [Actinomycetales bacterium]|nr:hypothetical protein [Actinomycetales bacterium]
MQSNNPVLSRYEKSDKSGFAYQEGVDAYSQAAAGGAGAADVNTAFQTVTAAGGARLTINDVIVKTLGVFAVVVVFAVIGWNTVESMPWMLWVGLIGGMILGFVNALKKQPSPPLILLYAVFQGVLLGAISNFYNTLAISNQYEGIVLQAVIATMTTFGVMLALYLTGVIKVTKKFQSILMVAAVSYLLIGLASLVAALFGVGGGWGFYGVGGLGILIAVAGVLIASFFLLLDFEAINHGIRMGAPERESWRMAFGLLVTLIWIYLEFLRLLALLNRN